MNSEQLPHPSPSQFTSVEEPLSRTSTMVSSSALPSEATQPGKLATESQVSTVSLPKTLRDSLQAGDNTTLPPGQLPDSHRPTSFINSIKAQRNATNSEKMEADRAKASLSPPGEATATQEGQSLPDESNGLSSDPNMSLDSDPLSSIGHGQLSAPTVSGDRANVLKRSLSISSDTLSTSAPSHTKKTRIKEPDMLNPNWLPGRSRAVSPAGSVSSTTSSTGSKPVTFIFTLCDFLRDNPDSPYMRWSEDGTYFIIPDKDAVMDEVVSKLFNQKSYASFARQLNIYGWKRVQIASTDDNGGEQACTMWKHTEVTRDSTEEVIGNVKRNAQDKVRRPSRGSDDLSSDDRVARARVAVTMRSNLDSQSSARGTHRKVLGKAALASPVSPAFAHAETWAGKSRWNHLTRGGRLPLLTQSRSQNPPPRQPTAFKAGNGQPMLRLRLKGHNRVIASKSDKQTKEVDVGSGGHQATVPIAMDVAAASTKPAANSPTAASSPSSSAAASTPSTARTAIMEPRLLHSSQSYHTLSSQPVTVRAGSPFKILPHLTGAERQEPSRNPVDVYIACAYEGSGAGVPTIIARDRLDVPLWLDDFAQARFVLAGEIMRNWVVWEIFPSNVLLYVASADSLRPPRPIGIPTQLKDSNANGDPSKAFSRERIYLENPAEPGSVGQCCLVFKMPAAKARPTSRGEQDSASALLVRGEPSQKPSTSSVRTAAMSGASPFSINQVAKRFQPLRNPALALASNPPQSATGFPMSPKVNLHAPVSEERGTRVADSPIMEVRSKVDASTLQSTNTAESAERRSSLSDLKTPRTVEAIHSLAFLQMQHYQHETEGSGVLAVTSPTFVKGNRSRPSSPLAARKVQLRTDGMATQSTLGQDALSLSADAVMQAGSDVDAEGEDDSELDELTPDNPLAATMRA